MNASSSLPRLGVNIDHIATLRQLRGTPYPSLLETAELCERAGAEQITVHLREDRRHIQDADVVALKKFLQIPLNLEMAVSPEIVRFALKIKPDWCCLVPEKRNEVTTEGGLNVVKQKKVIAQTIQKLKKAKIKVSLFIEPSAEATQASVDVGADAVEFHTGRYCLATQATKPSVKMIARELKRIESAALFALKCGIPPHAGHGLDYVNVAPIVNLTRSGGSFLIEEYNIGHSIICRAAIVGMERAVREMVSVLHAP